MYNTVKYYVLNKPYLKGYQDKYLFSCFVAFILRLKYVSFLPAYITSLKTSSGDSENSYAVVQITEDSSLRYKVSTVISITLFIKQFRAQKQIFLPKMSVVTQSGQCLLLILPEATCAITRTRLCKYVENFTSRNWKISDENLCYFSYFCSKHRLWYSLEPPQRGGSVEYPQSMFLSRNKKNNVYPCKPQFYFIKVGLKGVKII